MNDVRDQDFDAEVIQSDTPVIVDFWATWCGPCRAMEPVLEGLEAEYTGRIKIVRVDVQQAPNTALRFMVQSVPTFLFMRGGQVVRQMVGAGSPAKMRAAIEQLLAG